MKFVIEKDSILEVLPKVQSVIVPRPAFPMLHNVMIEANDGQLVLTATDQDMSVRAFVKAEVEEPGATTLPARRFFSICRDAPTNEIRVSVDENNLAEICSGASSFKLEGLDAADYPPFPSMDEGVSYELKQPVLKELLQKTYYAASTDESRAILNGSLLSFRNGKLTVVCTDGRRLALIEHELDEEVSEVDLVVPNKTVQELIKTLSDDGVVMIKTSASQIAFELGNVFIVSKLIEGTYPNYRQVIPSQCEERITIEREVLLSAVRRVALMLDDQSASVRLNITENQIELLTSLPQVGEGREVIPVKYSGKDITIAFNPGYLAAPLKHLDSDEVYLELSDELSPGVLKSNIPFLYVIMPIRVK